MDRDERLTPNFTAGEFLHSDTAERAGIAFPDPPAEIEANIRKVATKAQQARDILGVRTDVNNGWRPTAPVDINNMVGGSPTSAHAEGLAADLIPAGMPLPVALRALTTHATFMSDVDQLIIERGCLHMGLPCRASNYKARNEIRTETYTFNQKLQKQERHYPLLCNWKPKEALA